MQRKLRHGLTGALRGDPGADRPRCRKEPRCPMPPDARPASRSRSTSRSGSAGARSSPPGPRYASDAAPRLARAAAPNAPLPLDADPVRLADVELGPPTEPPLVFDGPAARAAFSAGVGARAGLGVYANPADMLGDPRGPGCRPRRPPAPRRDRVPWRGGVALLRTPLGRRRSRQRQARWPSAREQPQPAGPAAPAAARSS